MYIHSFLHSPTHALTPQTLAESLCVSSAVQGKQMMPSVIVRGAAAMPKALLGGGLAEGGLWWAGEGVGSGAAARIHVPFVTSDVTLSRTLTVPVPAFPHL